MMGTERIVERERSFDSQLTVTRRLFVGQPWGSAKRSKRARSIDGESSQEDQSFLKQYCTVDVESSEAEQSSAENDLDDDLESSVEGKPSPSVESESSVEIRPSRKRGRKEERGSFYKDQPMLKRGRRTSSAQLGSEENPIDLESIAGDYS